MTCSAASCALFEMKNANPTFKLTVSGWSMLPTLFPGDVLYCEFDQCRVGIGDIAAFSTCKGIVAHRIIGICHDSTGETLYKTKGDSRVDFDEPFREAQLCGKVKTIRQPGTYSNDESFALRKRMAAVLMSMSLVAVYRVGVGLWLGSGRLLPLRLFTAFAALLCVPVRLAMCLLAPVPPIRRGSRRVLRMLAWLFTPVDQGQRSKPN